ncbi:MAG: biopolymer transporter ExbD, partial [Planctomycetes bacterium]|nr:biopolymer transporter ExbD [Planctomycetota bacterium]
SASATSPETAKSGSASQSSAAEPTDLSDLVIKISQREGKLRYFLQNEDIDSLEQIASRLNSILKVRNDVPIIIDPEDSVPAGEAIRVYDLVRANGSISVFLVAR